MITILKAYLPHIVGVVVLCLLVGVYLAGRSAGADSVIADWDAANAKAAAQQALREAAYRQIERAMGEAVAELWTSMRDAQEATQDEYEGVIADIESGALRLRSDLAGCRSRVPPTAGAPAGDHGAGEAGLSAERQRVALQIFRDADQVVRKLEAAQTYIAEVCLRAGT